MKLLIFGMMITALPLRSAVADFNTAFELGYTDVEHRWTIDNSGVGGLRKASELTWSTKAALIQANVDWNGYSGSVYFMKDINNGDFLDDDWGPTQNYKYSSTTSAIDYWQFGFNAHTQGYVFASPFWSDKAYVHSHHRVYYESWDGIGLVDNFTGEDEYPGKKVISFQTLSYQNQWGITSVWESGYGDHELRLSLVSGLQFSRDNHWLRSDLHKNSFDILAPNLGLQAEYRYEYKMVSGNSIGLKARYAYVDGSLGSLWVRLADGSKHGVGLGDNVYQALTLSAYYDARLF